MTTATRDRLAAARDGLRLAAAPALLTLAITLTGIGQRQFWRDEQATWWASTLPLGQLRRLVEVVDLVLLPYYLLMHFWIKVFGTSEIAMRVPSALFMSLAAGLLALLGARFVDAPAGLLAGLLFALVPAVSRYGGEARPYAMALAATLTATLLLLHALDRPSPRRWAGYAIALIWLGLSHLIALTVLAAHLLLVIARLHATHPGRLGHAIRTGRAIVIGWAVAVGAALVAVAPVIWFGSGQDEQIGWIPEPTWPVVRAFPGELFISTPAAVLILLLALIGIGLALASKAQPAEKTQPAERTQPAEETQPAEKATRWTAAVLLVWILLPPTLAYLTFDALGLFYPRYFLFVLPAVLIAAAWALRRLATTRRRLIATGLAAALTLGVAGFPQQRFVRSNAVEDEYAWKETARWLNDRFQPGDRVAYTGYIRLHRGFSYEFSRLPGPDPGEVYSYVSRKRTWWWSHNLSTDPARALAGVDRFWLVTAHPEDGPLTHIPPDARDYFEDNYTVAETATFHHLQATLLLSR
ncbi:glycosyltransferase family 39 protein [Actinoplanes sp. DH11]|uniref:glycosyltransferase family 39 protein n=1 Tax=Actinoplanes sp. DH11 TaxID=2857011 RepID=UPI001E509639|nr:glycosyltransferase family 39 protein [Actinoplanes sp. DH11]